MGSTNYTYTYNHKMQRVGKNWTGNDRDYVYNLGGQLLHETMASGNQDYVWLNGELIGVVTSATPASTKYLAALDQIGTPTRLYGSDGKPKWAADKEAFGTSWEYVPGSSAAPAISINLGFPGQWKDAETGLYNNWYRYYDPSSGRYLQGDPMIQEKAGFDEGVYSYVLNKPLLLSDPAGLAVFRCHRPLHNMPGELGPISHTYLCVKSGRGSFCAGQTAGGSIGGGPGRPTRPDEGDIFDPSRCELISEEQCVDECVRAVATSQRPDYDWKNWDGDNCHKWERDLVNNCKRFCSGRR